MDNNTNVIDYDHIYEVVNSVNDEPQVSIRFAVGMALGYILYGVAIIFGIPCNVFVLYRMYKFAKYCREVFRYVAVFWALVDSINIFTIAFIVLVSLVSC